jgi:hypothetical protein
MKDGGKLGQDLRNGQEITQAAGEPGGSLITCTGTSASFIMCVQAGETENAQHYCCLDTSIIKQNGGWTPSVIVMTYM